MTYRTTTAGLLLALLLAACGSTPAQRVQNAIQDHTRCPTANYVTPQYTPAGDRIIYTVSAGKSSGIHSMNTTGGDDHELVGSILPNLSIAGGGPLLSPDGNRVLYQRLDPNNPASLDYTVVDITTGQTRPIKGIFDTPSWSPDSRWLAYKTYDWKQRLTQATTFGDQPLMKQDVVTGETVQLTDGGGGPLTGDTAPLWSPGPTGDGKGIAFWSDRGGVPGLYLMDSDGGHVRQLAAPGGSACPGYALYQMGRVQAWQPGGGLLAYVGVCGDPALHLVTPDGEQLTGLSYQVNGATAVDWSGDGKRVLVLVNATGADTFYTADSDGGNLATFKRHMAEPRWSPDGTRIVFVGPDSAGLDEIYSMAPDGSDIRQLTANPGGGAICLH